MTIKWETARIGDIASVVTGKTPSSKNPHHFGEVVPFVTPTDFGSYHKHVRDAERYLSHEGVNALRKKVLPPESVLVTCIGSQMGKVAITEVDCVTNQQINSIVCDKERVDPHFVYYSLMNLYPLLRRLAADGTTMPIVNKGDFERIEIPMPSRRVQQRIAGILGALDDKIEVNRRINRTLEEMAQTLYKHWFVDFGPFQAGEFVGSELGAVPAGWEAVNIGSISEVVNGSTPSTKVDEYWNGDICWATPTDMTALSSPVIFDTDRKITQVGLDSCSASLLPAGSVLVTSRATLGVTAINYVPMATNQGFKSMVCGPRATNHFMLLHMQLNTEELERHAGGSTYPEINTRSFKALKLILPPLDVMQDFDRIVKPYYDQIYAHERENRKLAETRDYLLPKLLSGEVPAAEAVVEGRPAGSEVAGYEQPALL